MPPVRVVVRVLLLLMFALMLAGPIEALQVGDKAPDFALNNPDGKPVKLADLTAKGPVVLYTFVAAFTPT
jgi:cytochrome oxidase Cu insertion factor (SCO1/SenC/PrrC family)